MAIKKTHTSKIQRTDKIWRFLFWGILIAGLILRVINLNWGAPYYFHPDERNVAAVIDQNPFLSTHALTQSTFSYGNLPILLILFIKLILTPFQTIPFLVNYLHNSFLLLRTESFLFSVGILILSYIIGTSFSRRIGLLFLIFVAFSPGLIQQAHFGTFDTFVTFWALLSFFFLLKFNKERKKIFFLLSLLVISVGAAAKINLLIIAAIPIIYLLYTQRKKDFLSAFLTAAFGGIMTLLLTFLLSPYYLTAQFWGMFAYERGVVSGSLPVFYTDSFSGTTPFLFPMLHIYPFLINPLLAILFIPCVFFLIYQYFKSRNTILILLLLYFFTLSLPNSLLFTKWTRYLVPTLPFVYCAFAATIYYLAKYFKKFYPVFSSAVGVIIAFSMIYALAYTIVVFVYPDTRITAAQWAATHIPRTASILTEPYDLGIMPFQSVFPTIRQFDFYSLDGEDAVSTENTLQQVLPTISYIILPSTRVAKTRLRDAGDFPNGHQFYSHFFYNKNKFVLRYHTPCNFLCTFVYLGDPVNTFEETAYIFDRPTVYIFEKK